MTVTPDGLANDGGASDDNGSRRDNVLDIANIVGGSGNDSIMGTSANDNFTCNGNDILTGLGGDNTLNGGFGNDTLTSLEGADVLFAGPGTDTLDT